MNKLNVVDQETIKENNKKNIIQLLYKNNQLKKQEISKLLKISIPTVISNVKELIEEGYLEEAGVAESTGGRKPVIVKFLPDARYSIGVCVTSDRIRIAFLNLNLQIVAEEEILISMSVETVEKSMNSIHTHIENMRMNLGIPRNKLIGVGFSLPGTVNEEKLLLENAPNLKLKNICLKKYEEQFGYKFYIENEANAAAYAEAFLNFNSAIKSLIFISITEGIGTGIIIGDSLYKGCNKGAGEFGHMTIVKDGEQCNCGKKGCWELYASEKSLLKECNNNLNRKDKNLKSFFELTETNKEAKKILDKYLEYLAEGIKNIILILDPEKVILGGEIACYEDYFKELLKEKVFEKNSFYTEEGCKLLFSSLKEDASILGAALMTMQDVFFLNKKII